MRLAATAGVATSTVTFDMTFSSKGAVTDSTLNSIKNSLATLLQTYKLSVLPSDISLSIKTTLIRTPWTNVVTSIKTSPAGVDAIRNAFTFNNSAKLISDLNSQLVNDAILVTLSGVSELVCEGCGK